jgi:hypothetical protein
LEIVGIAGSYPSIFLPDAHCRAKWIAKSADGFCRRPAGRVFPKQHVFIAKVGPDESIALDEELKEAPRAGKRCRAGDLAFGVRDFDVVDDRRARPSGAPISDG